MGKTIKMNKQNKELDEISLRDKQEYYYLKATERNLDIIKWMAIVNAILVVAMGVVVLVKVAFK